MKIIIAEHSDIIRSRLGDLIHEIPHVDVVGEATQTSEMITLVDQHHPHLVFLNLHLPGGSPLETLRVIKSATPAPTVIVLTDNLSPEYQHSCRSAGADYVFDQALDIAKIQNLLKTLSQSGPS